MMLTDRMVNAARSERKGLLKRIELLEEQLARTKINEKITEARKQLASVNAALHAHEAAVKAARDELINTPPEPVVDYKEGAHD